MARRIAARRLVGVKCSECRNPVRSNGSLEPEPLCGKCLITPVEIRNRQIYGCISISMMPTPEQLEARKRKERADAMGHATAKVHRSRFALVKVPA